MTKALADRLEDPVFGCAERLARRDHGIDIRIDPANGLARIEEKMPRPSEQASLPIFPNVEDRAARILNAYTPNIFHLVRSHCGRFGGSQ